MTQKDKDLLLKDLCARLPYNPLISINGERYRMEEISHALIGIDTYKTTVNGCDIEYWNIKPYLFPLSSMTEEQKSYLYFNTKFEVDMFGKLVVKMASDDNYLYTDISDYTSIINWLNANKFDYRGLIPMGLANDASGLNIY